MNPTFPLARSLCELGHEVVYAGVEQLRNHVEAQGYAYFVQAVDVYPMFEHVMDNSKAGFWMHLAQTVKNRIRPKPESNRMQFARGASFNILLRATKPDIIIVDNPYAQFSLALHKTGIPFGIIQCVVNLDRRPGCPPLDSTYVPTQSRISQWICALLWHRYFLKRFILNAVGEQQPPAEKTARRLARNAGIDPSAVGADRYSNMALKDVPEFITSPQAFDFPSSLSRNQIYIGPSVYIDRVESSCDQHFKDRFEQMIAARELSGTPLVYCSLGTASWRYKGVTKFLQRVLEAAEKMHWNLILAVGNESAFSQYGGSSESIAVFKVVPQLQVLKYADLMITHGGMNSITECILSGVPMLVYPGASEFDQAGNAARVVYHGLGLQGVLARESTRGIIRNASKILSDSQYRKRVRAMSQKIKSSQGWVSGAAILLRTFNAKEVIPVS
ncbi:MAG: hypothetical protein IPP19_14285 [Verrucomicrobia bacterium]|nr:hypothetical protein [Verrucomicrobiota bacterium]